LRLFTQLASAQGGTPRSRLALNSQRETILHVFQELPQANIYAEDLYHQLESRKQESVYLLFTELLKVDGLDGIQGN